MRRVLLWATSILILVAGLAVANLRRDPHPIDVDWQLFRPSPPVVVVGRPTPGPIARTIAAKGVVEPVHQAQVVAKVSGKVAEVRVEEGSLVHKGDILFKLDDATFRTRADSTRTRLDTARTNLDKAEAHLRDVEKDPAAATTPAATPVPASPLTNIPGVPPPPPVGPSKLEVARNSVDGWKRERKSAENSDEAARTDLDRATIRAAIDGVVEDLAVEVGDDVLASPTVSVPQGTLPTASAGLLGGMGLAAGGESPPRPEALAGPARPLCRLLNPDQLRVRAWIDEADVGLVLADQAARIFLPDEPAVPVGGRISKVAARGRPNGEVVSYAATIDFHDLKRHPRVGMRVNVEVEVSRKEAPLGVPVQAVMHRKRRDVRPALTSRTDPSDDADSNYLKAVFVLDGNQVRLRPIQTGVSDERRVEVVAGLAPTDRLVVGPFRALDTLEDGFVVRSEMAPEDVPGLTQGLTSLGRRPAR